MHEQTVACFILFIFFILHTRKNSSNEDKRKACCSCNHLETSHACNTIY